MKIAIMQPYFFPYIGYFQLISAVDRFILLDKVQYISQGWINRNRILKPVYDDYIYIGIPAVKHSFQTLIKDIKAVPGEEWKTKIINQLAHYKKAPYYKVSCNLLLNCFQYSENDITRLNAHYLKAICDYIGINFRIEIQSEMDLDYSSVDSAEQRLVRLCQQLNASQYINPIGGSELYNKDQFEKFNIKLNFIQANLKEYNQQRKSFLPGLSILDVIMFNSPEEVRLMLKDYNLL
jgi:hypothetical protein